MPGAVLCCALFLNMTALQTPGQKARNPQMMNPIRQVDDEERKILWDDVRRTRTAGSSPSRLPKTLSALVHVRAGFGRVSAECVAES